MKSENQPKGRSKGSKRKTTADLEMTPTDVPVLGIVHEPETKPLIIMEKVTKRKSSKKDYAPKQPQPSAEGSSHLATRKSARLRR